MTDPEPGHSLPQSQWTQVRKALLGGARDVRDPSLHHKISLIAILAWVGLGADGLSSSAYGPEEAFKALGEHRPLALVLAAATAFTVFIISYTYTKIIEHFPHGGGGYLVATKLLGESAGVVSGSALLIDYVLTITVSIAAGGDAIFSLLPSSFLHFKMPLEFTAILLLIVMNLRGVKESVTALVPIFLVFLLTHILLIGGGIIYNIVRVPEVVTHVSGQFQEAAHGGSLLALCLLIFRAYSLGGGTYTGIEAVSNGVAILREPKVETGKRTMLYMSLSLALTAGGLLLCYLLADIRPHEGKTLNTVLADNLVGGFSIFGVPIGAGFVWITIFSEAVLLLVAAQTGFLDGPRVMANMAIDNWLPRRFGALSDRLTMQNGILLMGMAAIGLLIYTGGKVDKLVVMYSINVFLTFSLSQLGMCRHWIQDRHKAASWKRNLGIHMIGLFLCAGILVIMTYEKFAEGAWVTVILTGSLIAVCFLIRKHYRNVVKKIIEVKRTFQHLANSIEPEHAIPASLKNAQQTAVILVGAFDGMGIHLLLNVLRLFPNVFNHIVFISIGVIDSGFFKGDSHVEEIEERTRKSLDRYVDLARRLGITASSMHSLGTDVVQEASTLCVEAAKKHRRCLYFAGEILFDKPVWYHRFLHNETSYAIQRQIRFAGLTMVVLPLLLNNEHKRNEVKEVVTADAA